MRFTNSYHPRSSVSFLFYTVLIAQLATRSFAGDVGIWKDNIDAARKCMVAEQIPEADKHFRAALKEALDFKGKHVPKLLETYNRYASFKFEISQPAAGIDLVKEAVRTGREHYRPNDIELAGAIADSGFVAGHYGRLAEAEAYYAEAIKIVGLRLGRYSEGLAHIRLDFGEICRINKSYDKAEEQLKLALEVLGASKSVTRMNNTFSNTPNFVQDKTEANYSGAAFALRSLTKVYRAQEKIPEATKHFELLVKTAERERGRPDLVSHALLDYGQFQRELKAWDKAESILQRALAFDTKRFGQEDGRLFTVLSALVSLYQDAGKPTEADRYSEPMLRAKEKFYGPKHSELAENWTTLGDTRFSNNDLAGAERAFVQALIIDERQRGAVNLVLLPLLGKLATVYEKIPDDSKLTGILNKQLVIAADTFGAESKAVLPILDKQAAALRRQQRVSDAEALEAKASKIRQAN